MFQAKIAVSVIAFLGVIGAAVYALRLFIAAIHNRVGRGGALGRSWLREAVAIVPIVLVILVLAFYPQFGLQALGADGARGDRVRRRAQARELVHAS